MQPIRILLVDDSEDLRLLCRLILEAGGEFEICGESENGRDALEKVGTCRPDVVVLDLDMPVMDGLTALPLLRESHPSVPVVVLTAGATPDVCREALRRGAHAAVGKDPAMHQLKVAILGACEKRRPQASAASSLAGCA